MKSRPSGRRGLRWGLALLAAASPLVLPSPLSGQEADPGLVAEGQTLFTGVALCFACHGPAGKGVRGAGVDLTDDELLHDDGSYEALVQRIINGVGVEETRSGVIMLPRGGSSITDDQVQAVAAYVFSLRSAAEELRPEA